MSPIPSGYEFGFDPRTGFTSDEPFAFGGFGFGHGHRGRRGGPERGRRGRRGDVRAAILTLLTERPMHGYEMIQEIAERSHNLWRPSPGSVYPTLQLLVDEGLISGTDAEGSKKLFELTSDGHEVAEKLDTPPWEQFIDHRADEHHAHADLRNALGQLMGAAAQSTYTCTEDQQERVVAIINNARREIYQILGEE